MAKLLVIRWVVPLIVMTPAATTASQNTVTSSLWRNTKRVSACMTGLRGPVGRPAVRPPGTPASLPISAPRIVGPRQSLARTPLVGPGPPVLPAEYAVAHPAEDDGRDG